MITFEILNEHKRPFTVAVCDTDLINTTSILNEAGRDYCVYFNNIEIMPINYGLPDMKHWKTRDELNELKAD